jgi:hypothetical protein
VTPEQIQRGVELWTRERHWLNRLANDAALGATWRRPPSSEASPLAPNRTSPLEILVERLDRDEPEKRLSRECQSIAIDGSDVYCFRGFVNCARTKTF